VIRKENNLLPKLSTSIWVKMRKGKIGFIKNNISGDIDATGRNIKALEAFVKGAVTKEGTPNRPKREFASVVWSQVGPTGTAKYPKGVIIWLFFEKARHRDFIVNDLTWEEINEVCCSEERLVPKLERHGSIGEQSKAHFDNVPMLPLGHPVLLVSMGA